jgi:uncharacterized protein (TIGR00290 family)
MMQRYERLLSWSGGKDAAFVLSGDDEALFTTFDEVTRLLPHTRVPIEAVEAQASSLGLPLIKVPVPNPWDEAMYEERLRDALIQMAPGAAMGFGDMYLEGLRVAREQSLSRAGLVASFPGWTRDTTRRAMEIVEAGVEAVVVSVDTRVLSTDVLGRRFDAQFLSELPTEVDRCGERGEFQTFVIGHPRFSSPIRLSPGDLDIEGDHALLALHVDN